MSAMAKGSWLLRHPSWNCWPNVPRLLTVALPNFQIAKAVDDEVVSRDLVPAFVKLLKDGEAEVRTAIAGQIPGFCALVDRTTLLNEVMSSIEDLVSDGSQHVRSALSTHISGLAPI